MTVLATKAGACSRPGRRPPYGRSVALAQIAGLTVRTWGDPVPDQPVVLALAGLTSKSAVWDDRASRLPGIPVVSPDLPGRGFSVGAQAAPGLPGLAEAVVRVVDRLGDRTTAVVLLDGGVAPEPSRLLRPVIVRTLFAIQLPRLPRTWTNIDRYTAVAEGGAAANRPALHRGFRAWSEAVLEPYGRGWRPRLDAGRIVAGGWVILRLTWERVEANHATMLFDPATARVIDGLLTRPADPRD